jgi:hypothetical protein
VPRFRRVNELCAGRNRQIKVFRVRDDVADRPCVP